MVARLSNEVPANHIGYDAANNAHIGDDYNYHDLYGAQMQILASLLTVLGFAGLLFPSWTLRAQFWWSAVLLSLFFMVLFGPKLITTNTYSSIGFWHVESPSGNQTQRNLWPKMPDSLLG